MLFPKKIKFRKWHTERRNLKKASVATRGVKIAFGSHALKAVTAGKITSNQIEAARKVTARATKKTGKMWIRIFPDRPYTTKPAEVKMGKGKGDPQGFCVEVDPGRVLFEVDGISDALASEVLRKAGTKLPVKTKIVKRF
ncbi:MAG: 50S ribosomal protein L16 [Patescibacteria group bacterium]